MGTSACRSRSTQLALHGLQPLGDAIAEQPDFVAMSTRAACRWRASPAPSPRMGDGVHPLGFHRRADPSSERLVRGPVVAYPIPAGTYPSQDTDVTTIAAAELPRRKRRRSGGGRSNLITKAIFENLPFLQAIHPATNEMRPRLALAGCRCRCIPARCALRGSRLTVPDSSAPLIPP